jgi:hypothetical protein
MNVRLLAAPKLSASLKRCGIDRFSSIEINPLNTIETYVADGFCVGLNVSIPKTKLSPKVRSPALKAFAPAVPSAVGRGKPSSPMRTLLDELQVTTPRLRH